MLQEESFSRYAFQDSLNDRSFELKTSVLYSVTFSVIGERQVIYTQCLLFCPQLEGVSEPVVLQVFVANDAGRVKPHGFYQACRVTGRNTTACKEVDIEGTTVIEIPLEPSSDMTLA